MKKTFATLFFCLINLSLLSQNGTDTPVPGRQDTLPGTDHYDRFFAYGHNAYKSIAFGFGQSYGGFGVRFQQRFGKKTGFGYHVGLGYSVNDMTGLPDGLLASAGMKFFFYKAFYVNLQFAPVLDYTVLDDNRLVVETGTVWGPVFLVGGDWFFNKKFGMSGAIGRAWNLTKPEALEDPMPRIEFGFNFKF